MRLLYTEYILKENPKLVINVFEKKKTDVYEVLKELIIIELILNSYEINAKEIQVSFNDFFMSHKEYLPSKYFDLYDKKGKKPSWRNFEQKSNFKK